MKGVLKSLIVNHQSDLNVDADNSAGKNAVITNSTIEINHGLVFASPLEKESVLKLRVVDGNDSALLQLPFLHQSVLIASIKAMELDVVGTWKIEILSIQKVATLLSFMDYHFINAGYFYKKGEGHEPPTTLYKNSFLNISIIEGCYNRFMNILTCAILNRREKNLESIAPFIRNLESYWLAYFLLSQAMNEGPEKNSCSVYNAHKAYGVSESQFRKLCYDVFSRGPKKQLCLWRAAHSALQLIEKKKSVSAIAHMNGYASSSHFASELKTLFGITPREFKKIEGFLDEDTSSKRNLF